MRPRAADVPVGDPCRRTHTRPVRGTGWSSGARREHWGLDRPPVGGRSRSAWLDATPPSARPRHVQPPPSVRLNDRSSDAGPHTEAEPSPLGPPWVFGETGDLERGGAVPRPEPAEAGEEPSDLV